VHRYRTRFQPIQEGIMLAWNRLSGSQRTYGAFLVLLFLCSARFFLMSAESISHRAQIGGALLCCLGLILNPATFSRPVLAATDFQTAPRVCRQLYVAGAVLFFAGIVLTPLFL
jgi:hypothetical protein